MTESLASPLDFFKGLFIAHLLINMIPSQGAPSSKNYIKISLTAFFKKIPYQTYLSVITRPKGRACGESHRTLGCYLNQPGTYNINNFHIPNFNNELQF